MSGKVSLSRTQVRAIAALLQSRTIEEAAACIKVCDRTLYRWLADPLFQHALRQAETDAISEAVRVLVADLKANHETLRRLRDNPPPDKPELSLRAAIALDNSLLRWRELLDVEIRVTRLEEALLEKH